MTNTLSPKNVILYADDDQDDLALVMEAFETYANNVEVVTVTNGSQALSFLSNLSTYDPSPCLIILDINMPIMDGKEALIRIREMDRFDTVPVVLFTTSSLPADKTFAYRYKAGFVTKPLSIKQMQAIADQFIDNCAEEIREKIRRQIL